MISELELQNMWYYYLELEKDLAESSRYIEPVGQENVYSFEFRKIIILTCSEIETVFKALCEEIDASHSRGNMNDYKKVILSKYPKIVDAVTYIPRWHKSIKPFESWENRCLLWWNVHQHIKHDKGAHMSDATYKSAVYSLSALYILIFYLAEITNNKFSSHTSTYIFSDYNAKLLSTRGEKKLPDFEN